MQEEEYSVAPRHVEVNDPVSAYARIRAAPGAIVTGGGIDGFVRNLANNKQQLRLEGTKIPLWPKTETVTLSYTVRTHEGDFGSSTNKTLFIIPESNGYIATRENAEAFIMNNLKIASVWALHGLAGGWATTPADWEAGWPLYFNGIDNPPDDPELDHLVFWDVGDGITGNIMQIYTRDGSVLGVGGMPEYEIDQFRITTRAELPK